MFVKFMIVIEFPVLGRQLRAQFLSLHQRDSMREVMVAGGVDG